MQSPEYAKMSHATAISLGLIKGRMYRGAVNRCVNLLVHYGEGCTANCAYCGLASRRPGTFMEKSFINVDWPVYSMEKIIQAINNAPAYVKRTCISMITNGKCRQSTLDMAKQLKKGTSLPISVLVAPTIINEEYLITLKDTGIDKIGIALDLAAPDLFDKYRGKGVSGPHEWDYYMKVLHSGLEVFGHPNVGAHLMVGMGETEKEVVALMAKLWKMGVINHLFSFFPEKGSAMEDHCRPPWPAYLRIQLARYLIEKNMTGFEDMRFNHLGEIIDLGIEQQLLRETINLGTPFMTTGCTDPDGRVACNRPFGNCLPDIRQ